MHILTDYPPALAHGAPLLPAAAMLPSHAPAITHCNYPSHHDACSLPQCNVTFTGDATREANGSAAEPSDAYGSSSSVDE